MPDIWDFLKDPANRDVLAWIGGGAVAVAGGVWAVVKFVAGRGKGKSSGVRADRRSVAIGGHAKNSPISVSNGHTAQRSKKR